MTARRLFLPALLAATLIAAPLTTLTQPTTASAEPAAAAPADGVDPGLTLSDIASRGEGGWLRYRIPSLTQAPNGDLLAIYDGRPTMADLPSNITLLMRRSSDGGRTWGAQTIIRQEAAPNGFGDPSVLVDRVTGKVFVFYAASINAGFASSGTGSDPADPNVLHADYSVSSDNGTTWTHHRITSALKAGKTNWGGMFAASGEGIQLRHGEHAGRLIQQYTVRIGSGNYAVSAYSDDHGATWKTSAPVGPGADENKTVELSHGDVLLNSRAAPYRRVATSTDGGATYSSFVQDTELPDPANNGSIIRAYPEASASDPKSKILLFSNSANSNVRRNLTVRMSCDDGQTWPVSKVVQSGASAYSTLTALRGSDGKLGGRYGLLYERDGYRHLSYTSFDLAWLGGVCASLSVDDKATYYGGVATDTSVVIANPGATALPAGTIAVADDQRFTSPKVTVPAIAAGQSATVTIPVTPKPTADTRTHPVRFDYRAGGLASVTASLKTMGGAPAFSWADGGTFAPGGQYVDVTTSLSTVSGLSGGTIVADFTQTANATVGTLFSAANSGSTDKDVILSINSGRPYFEVRVGGAGQRVRIASTTTITNGTRYQLVATVTASGASLYLNGQLIGSATTTGFVADVPGVDAMTIGGNNQARADKWMFNGQVHAVQVLGAVQAEPSLRIAPVLDAIYTAGGDGLIDDKIQPWLEVTNTGNVALTSIAFTNPGGATACNYSSLAPGASYACRNQTPSHIITAADLSAGQWSESYSATARFGSQTVTAQGTLFPVQLADSTPPVTATSVWLPTGSFASSSFVRVPQTGQVGDALASDAKLKLTVPRNGRASAQLAVTASSALTGLRVDAGQLTHTSGASVASAVKVRYPAYVPNKAGGGVVADPLRDVPSVPVAAGQNQPVWLTVQMPADAAPGDYTATLTVQSAAGEVGRWPLTVTVPDVTYRPMAERPFSLDLWAQPSTVADHLGLEVWSEEHFQALKPYWADLAAAGQRVVNVAITEDPWLVNHKGAVRAQTASPYRSTVAWRWDGNAFSFDFTAFDRIVTDSRAAGIGNAIHAFAMLQFHNYDRITYTDTRTGAKVTEQVEVGSARYREAWTAFLTAFKAHLEARGWFNDTRLAFDEQPLNRMNAAFDIIKAVSPDWEHKIALAANTLAEADIAEAISFNYSFLDQVPQQLIERRRAAGQPTLFYTWAEPVVPNTVTATPPFNSRTLGWVVEQRNLDGYLRWTYNSWPTDVFTDPSFRYAQGDEYLVYPGETGPVSSVRWELFRDGQDDAELLNLARKTLGSHDARLTAALAGVNAEAASVAASWNSLLTHRETLLTALAQGPAAVVVDGEMTASSLSARNPGFDSVLVSVPVRNTSRDKQTVTFAVRDATVFSGEANIELAPGETKRAQVRLRASKAGADHLTVALLHGTNELIAQTFDLIAGGYYLSDVDWISATNGWGPVERDTANGEDQAGDGPPLRLAGRTYAKGLGVHANSTVTYDLGGKCTELSFDYGIDDTMVRPNSGASVTMHVRGDGTERWATPGIIRATSGKGSATVDVTGVQRLELIVDGQGSIGQDHADWANLWVRCAVPDVPTPSVTLSATQVKPGDRLTITGTGFAPGDDVRVELHSDPVLLGTVAVADDGTAKLEVVIPEVPAGDHQIVLAALQSGLRGSQSITVLAVEPVNPTPTITPAPTKPSSGRPLPQTGGEFASWLLLMGLAGAGVAAAAAKRRAR